MTIKSSISTADSQPHSWPRTLGLHLLPGAIITLAFVIIAALTTPRGWPASLALLVTWCVVGLPLEAGILLYYGRQRKNKPSSAKVILYREPLPLRHYLWLVPVLLIWTAAISTLLIPLGEGLRQALFSWWPDWLQLSAFARNLSQYAPSVVWAVVVMSFILNLAIPTIEELYFRGFLLPRLPLSRAWAPLISVVLFSLYHFWLPWENPARILALLPVVYAVQWKRSVALSIAVHCLLNTIGSIGLLALVLNQA